MGWLLPSGSTKSQTQTSPPVAAARMLSTCRRTGSASAVNPVASSAASDASRGEDRTEGQQGWAGDPEVLLRVEGHDPRSRHGGLPLTAVNVSIILDASTDVNTDGGPNVPSPTGTERREPRRRRRLLPETLRHQPAKRRPGYANFVIADPPLKLVLIEDTAQAPGALNHLGVEFESSEAVAEAQGRLAGQGLVTAVEDEVTCCFAIQDKVWVSSPEGVPWEFYTVLADTDSMRGDDPTNGGPDVSACCAACPVAPRLSGRPRVAGLLLTDLTAPPTTWG